MDISDDPRIKDFFNNRDLRKSTRLNYIRDLLLYCSATDLTPSELIAEAENEEDEGVRLRSRKIRSHLITFRSYLEDNNYAPSRIRVAMTTARTFYNEFEIQIPKVKVKSVEKNDNRDILTKEQIRKAYHKADSKFKAAILLHMSSGMGTSEVLGLTIGDFLKAISKCSETAAKGPLHIPLIRSEVGEDCIATWRISRVKTNMPYTTFSSPESVIAILNYLEERDVLKREYSLFRSAKGEWVQTKASYVYHFQVLNDKCKLGKQGRWNLFRTHNLRKFFATTLYRAGINQLACDWMLGHRIDKITDAYFLADDGHLKDAYMKALSDLSLARTETIHVESEEVKEIIRELDKKDQEIQNILQEQEKKDREIEEIKSKLAGLDDLDKLLNKPKVKRAIEEELKS